MRQLVCVICLSFDFCSTFLYTYTLVNRARFASRFAARCVRYNYGKCHESIGLHFTLSERTQRRDGDTLSHCKIIGATNIKEILCEDTQCYWISKLCSCVSVRCRVSLSFHGL